jgi:CheY-like chemotaxis protein
MKEHTPAPAPPHILLVDDTNFGLVARKTLLEELGCRITPAHNGVEALRHFGEAKFDLVITGHRVPQMDGVQLIKEIRAMADGMPIILISGFAEGLGLTETNTGANTVIQKGANEVAQLTRAVNRLLKKKPAKKPAASVRTTPRTKRKDSAQS